MRLYNIVADTVDGDSLDLFVWADHSRQAENLWRANYDDLANGITPRVFHIAAADCPAGRTPGVLNWHNDVVEL